MKMELGKRELLIISVILLLLLAWSIGNLNSSYFWMENDELDPEDEVDEFELGESEGGLQLNISQTMRYAFGIVILVSFGITFTLAPGEKKKEVLIRWTPVVGLIWLYTIFSEQVHSAISHMILGIRNILPDVDLPSISDISLGEGTQAGTPFIGFELVGVILFVLVSLLLAYIFIKKYMHSSPTETEEEDISSTAERAIKELHKGEDVKDVIIRNYQKMCVILEKEGVQQKESYTPRELERRAVEQLSLKETTIDEMTRLFEKAKYSDHPLGKIDRKNAIKNFKRIKNEIEVGS